jgi:hypothetical protein
MRVGGVPFHFIANLKDRGVLRFVRKIDLHHCFMDVESPDGYFCIRYHFLEGKFFLTVQRHEDGHLVAISSYFSKQLARSTFFLDCDAAAGVMISLYLLCCLESWNRSMFSAEAQAEFDRYLANQEFRRITGIPRSRRSEGEIAWLNGFKQEREERKNAARIARKEKKLLSIRAVAEKLSGRTLSDGLFVSVGDEGRFTFDGRYLLIGPHGPPNALVFVLRKCKSKCLYTSHRSQLHGKTMVEKCAGDTDMDVLVFALRAMLSGRELNDYGLESLPDCERNPT